MASTAPEFPAGQDASPSADASARLPDEVLEFILGLASPYGELRAARGVSRRWRDCSVRVALRRERALAAATREMALVWRGSPAPSSRESRDRMAVAGALPARSATRPPSPPPISKRYSHSACYDDASLSMFVFGGCTSTSSTFNDLWRLDLTTRTWNRPMATGTYPSPKACAAMVLHRPSNSLLLFGGWTHPSLYPLHQSWRLFNELHQYDIAQARWNHVPPNSSLKPPSMAGHSATIHRNGNTDLMVVFGGLQKQRNSIGQFSSSNDVWCFNLSTQCWIQCDIPDPRPTPRYGQSQLWLDDSHMLVLGGCGGPNNIFNDVWLLDMSSGSPAASIGGGGANQNGNNHTNGSAPHWQWFKCEVKNAESNGAHHMWCHPAVRVGDYAVVLGKTRSAGPSGGDKQASGVAKGEHHARKGGGGLSESETAQFNVIHQLRRGINRGYGAIRRQNTSERYQQRQPPERRYSDSSSDMDTSSPVGGNDDDDELDNDHNGDLSVEPLEGGRVTAASNGSGDPGAAKTFKTSVTLNVNQSEPSSQRNVSLPRQQSLDAGHPAPALSKVLSRHGSVPGPSALPRAPPEMARLQAFTSGSPSTYTSSSSLGAVPRNPVRQLETRQKQLDALKKMEERIKGLNSSPEKPPERSKAMESEKRTPPSGASGGKGCTCHRLSTFVLDISEVTTNRVVSWIDLKTDSPDLQMAPEETILYSLVRGRSELIMFGGIQKDVSSMTNRTPPSNASDTVSNSVFFLQPPKDII